MANPPINMDGLTAIIDTFTGPASYQTTGYAIYSMDAPRSLVYGQVISTGGGYTARVSQLNPNSTTTATILFYASGGTPVAGGTNLSGISFDMLFVGR